MQRKKYNGYKSFDYLEKKDYRQFEMEEEMGWGNVEPYEVPLSKSEEERFKKIVEKNIVISLHDHMMTLPKAVRDRAQLVAASRENRLPVSYEAVSKSCLDAVFDNGGNYFLMGGSQSGWKWDDCICDLGMRLCDIEHQDFFIECKRVEDIVRAHQEGKVAFIPSFESCTMIENELNRVEVLYGLGIRSLGITWSEANSLGSGLKERGDGGLTSFGHDVVERLNKIGIAIDIAHVGDQTSLDVIEASRKPVFISHAGARAVWNSIRMKPDEVLLACARKGGVIGIEAAPSTTLSEKYPVQGIESFFEHVKYCIDLMGIDHVAFGPDTMYGDHSGVHAVASEKFASALAKKGSKEPPKISYVKGLENPTECSNNVVRNLIKSGYSDHEIEKIIGGNVMRVLKEVWHN
jgi:membrane dipeptidase